MCGRVPSRIIWRHNIILRLKFCPLLYCILHETINKYVEATRDSYFWQMKRFIKQMTEILLYSHATNTYSNTAAEADMFFYPFSPCILLYIKQAKSCGMMKLSGTCIYFNLYGYYLRIITIIFYTMAYEMIFCQYTTKPLNF